MLTTLEIPDQILKHAKRRALEEGCTLKEVINQALTDELAATRSPRAAKWSVPVAPRNMGWNGLDEAAIQQTLNTQREAILLHRGGISRAKR